MGWINLLLYGNVIENIKLFHIVMFFCDCVVFVVSMCVLSCIFIFCFIFWLRWRQKERV